MLAGSDWPSAVPDMNPWTGMEALITRSDPLGEYPGVLWQEQAISLEQAIDLFTLSGARALRLDHQTGSLAVGKSADFIVLEDNLFDIAPSRISDTRVRMTFFHVADPVCKGHGKLAQKQRLAMHPHLVDRSRDQVVHFFQFTKLQPFFHPVASPNARRIALLTRPASSDFQRPATCRSGRTR